jgi:hypothetical protein
MLEQFRRELELGWGRAFQEESTGERCFGGGEERVAEEELGGQFGVGSGDGRERGDDVFRTGRCGRGEVERGFTLGIVDRGEVEGEEGGSLLEPGLVKGLSCVGGGWGGY